MKASHTNLFLIFDGHRNALKMLPFATESKFSFQTVTDFLTVLPLPLDYSAISLLFLFDKIRW